MPANPYEINIPVVFAVHQQTAAAAAAAARGIGAAAQAGVQPMVALGQATTNTAQRLQQQIAVVEAEIQTFGRSVTAIARLIALKRQLAATAIAGGGVVPAGAGRADVRALESELAGMRRGPGTISLMGTEFSPARLLLWALGWQAVYRGINLVAGGMRDAVASAFEFEQALRNVNTIAKLSESQLAAVGQEIRRMATDEEAGLRPIQELAKAMYEINSAGIVGTKSLDVLRAASKAAAAGLTDVNTAAMAIVTVLNAYGMAASDAGHVSDVLFKTVEVGIPNFERVASTFGDVAANASLAGIGLEDLGLVWAAATRIIGSAERVTTGLNQIILAFLKPSDAMKEAVTELGFASAGTMLKELGLAGALRELHKVTGDNAAAIRGLFENRRAYIVASALLNKELKALNDTERDRGKTAEIAGATDRALTENFKAQQKEIERLKRAYAEWALTIGEDVKPAITGLVGVLADLFTWLNRVREQTGPGGVIPGRSGVPGIVTMMQGERERRAAAAATFGRPELWARAIAEAEGAAGGRLPTRRQELTFAELQQMFERHRALGQFTTGAEIQAVGGILIPRLEKELEAARKLYRQRLEHPDLGPTAEDTKEALKEVEQLERELVSLEVDRIRLAKQLANEYKQQFEMLERASLALVEVRARARQAASALGIGVSEQLFQPFLQQRLERGLSASEVQRTFTGLRAQQDFVFARRRRDLEAELEDVQRGVREGRISPVRAAQEQFRIGQQLLDLTVRMAAARADLNREERASVEQARQRDAEGELDFLRQKLEILRSIGFEQAAQTTQQRIGVLEAQQEAAAGFEGLSAQQIQGLIDAGVQAILSGRLDFEADRAMRARIEAMRRELGKRREAEKQEAIDLAQAEKDAKGVADVYLKYIQPAIKTLVADAEDIVKKLLESTLALHGQVVDAWASMGKNAAAAFNKAFTDEYGRGIPVPGQRPQEPRNELPGRSPSAGINIYIGSADLTGKLSDSAKRELAAAVMGTAGDLAVQREARMTGGSPVA